ncbi:MULTISPECIES: MerR family transcriptional regulator [unclassified Microbacterium]|uniref:MerR family transcriptional regulator n=1 Tax=unclassified Microbacterium TaxID=2609290 RepID=UPI000D57E2D4|nr:MerR family DNA-binding transcriptional regulator [Microbacterium sp. Gd 4-13]PVW05350.1 MerR family transcriptional regulator [Microbacterium sp. Gd 4-13]
MGDRTMHIGELADRLGLSQRSLRHWDEIGLLTPSGRSDGNFRVYSEADEEKGRFVMLMKPLGFSLDEIAELAASRDASPQHPLAALSPERRTHFAEAARSRGEKLRRDLAAVDDFLALTDQE